MKFLRKLFGRDTDDEGEDVEIRLDQDTRRQQLLQLEQALDQLSREMRACESLDNPGWRLRVNEYNRLAGDAMLLRRGEITREDVAATLAELLHEPRIGRQILELDGGTTPIGEAVRANVRRTGP